VDLRVLAAQTADRFGAVAETRKQHLEVQAGSAAADAIVTYSQGLRTARRRTTPAAPLVSLPSRSRGTFRGMVPRWAAAFWMIRAQRLSPARRARFLCAWTNCRWRKLCAECSRGRSPLRSPGRALRTDRARWKSGLRSTRGGCSRGARGTSRLLQRTPLERARVATGGVVRLLTVWRWRTVIMVLLPLYRHL
jgi:hypothetical protein